jgi:hypothetical protein
LPCTWHIDVARRLATLEARGRVDVADMADAAMAMLGDPAFVPGTAQLVDLSGVEASDGSWRALASLAERGKDTEPAARLEGGRLAIVAPSDLAFGLARMYTVAAEPLPLEARAFRDRHDALAWLGVDEGPTSAGESP